MTEHTPTPWVHVGGTIIRDTHGVCITGDSSMLRHPANAAHIVKCVNLHDELLQAIQDLVCSSAFNGALFEKDREAHRAWTMGRHLLDKAGYQPHLKGA